MSTKKYLQKIIININYIFFMVCSINCLGDGEDGKKNNQKREQLQNTLLNNNQVKNSPNVDKFTGKKNNDEKYEKKFGEDFKENIKKINLTTQSIHNKKQKGEDHEDDHKILIKQYEELINKIGPPIKGKQDEKYEQFLSSRKSQLTEEVTVLKMKLKFEQDYTKNIKTINQTAKNINTKIKEENRNYDLLIKQYDELINQYKELINSLTINLKKEQDSKYKNYLSFNKTQFENQLKASKSQQQSLGIQKIIDSDLPEINKETDDLSSKLKKTQALINKISSQNYIQDIGLILTKQQLISSFYFLKIDKLLIDNNIIQKTQTTHKTKLNKSKEEVKSDDDIIKVYNKINEEIKKEKVNNNNEKTDDYKKALQTMKEKYFNILFEKICKKYCEKTYTKYLNETDYISKQNLKLQLIDKFKGLENNKLDPKYTIAIQDMKVTLNM